MKIHSTNYINTFIEVAPDTKANHSTPPPSKSKKTVGEMHFSLITSNPYVYTSDDVIFSAYAEKQDLTSEELEAARKQFFSKGQPCLRTSPLTKTYGYGIHCDKEGKIALYGMETDEYQQFVNDDSILKVKAMKSKK